MTGCTLWHSVLSLLGLLFTQGMWFFKLRFFFSSIKHSTATAQKTTARPRLTVFKSGCKLCTIFPHLNQTIQLCSSHFSLVGPNLLVCLLQGHNLIILFCIGFLFLFLLVFFFLGPRAVLCNKGSTSPSLYPLVWTGFELRFLMWCQETLLYCQSYPLLSWIADALFIL